MGVWARRRLGFGTKMADRRGIATGKERLSPARAVRQNSSYFPASPDTPPEPERIRHAGDVPAVAGAVQILRCLAETEAPVGVTQLARKLGLNTSTCFNILRTLVRADLVCADPDAKTYTLGLGLLDLARVAFAQGIDFGFAQPLMRQLAIRHGVTVTLWKPSGPDRMVLTSVAENDGVMRIRMSVGQRLPLLIGAMGRLNAAHGGMQEAELRRRFASLRWRRPFRFEEFAAEVELARQCGWAIDDGDFVGGVTTVSAPVIEVGSTIQAIISASMFAGQHDDSAINLIGSELADICHDVRRVIAPV